MQTLTQFDWAGVLYFLIGGLGAFTTTAPQGWVIPRLIAGSVLAGLTGLKAYMELSRASQQKITAARAEGAQSATGVVVESVPVATTVLPMTNVRVVPSSPGSALTNAAGQIVQSGTIVQP